MAITEWKVCPPFTTCYFAIRAPAERSSLRQHRDAGEEEVTSHPDQHEIDEEHEGPAEIVADHLALVAHELAGRHADAGGLRRDRLADLGPDRVQDRQQHQREAE